LARARTAKKKTKQNKKIKNKKQAKKNRRSEIKEKLKRFVARERTPLQEALLTIIFVRQFFALRRTSLYTWKRLTPQL